MEKNNQFDAISELYPQYGSYDELPDEVKSDADKNGTLEVCLLRYLYTEQQRVIAEYEKRIRNEAMSASLQYCPEGSEDYDILNALFRGIKKS